MKKITRLASQLDLLGGDIHGSLEQVSVPMYVLDRSGTRELWVVDLETGRLRQVTRLGGTRLPSWSPRLSTTERE